MGRGRRQTRAYIESSEDDDSMNVDVPSKPVVPPSSQAVNPDGREMRLSKQIALEKRVWTSVAPRPRVAKAAQAEDVGEPNKVAEVSAGRRTDAVSKGKAKSKRKSSKAASPTSAQSVGCEDAYLAPDINFDQPDSPMLDTVPLAQDERMPTMKISAETVRSRSDIADVEVEESDSESSHDSNNGKADGDGYQDQDDGSELSSEDDTNLKTLEKNPSALARAFNFEEPMFVDQDDIHEDIVEIPNDRFAPPEHLGSSSGASSTRAMSQARSTSASAPPTSPSPSEPPSPSVVSKSAVKRPQAVILSSDEEEPEKLQPPRKYHKRVSEPRPPHLPSHSKGKQGIWENDKPRTSNGDQRKHESKSKNQGTREKHKHDKDQRERNHERNNGERGNGERERNHDRGHREHERNREHGNGERGNGERERNHDRGHRERERNHDRGQGERDRNHDRGQGEREHNHDRGHREHERNHDRGHRERELNHERGNGERERNRDRDNSERGRNREHNNTNATHSKSGSARPVSQTASRTRSSTTGKSRKVDEEPEFRDVYDTHPPKKRHTANASVKEEKPTRKLSLSKNNEVDSDDPTSGDDGDDSIELVYPSQGGKLGLLEQHPRVRRVVRDAMARVTTNLFLKNAFPEGMAKHNDLSRRALVKTAEDREDRQLARRIKKDDEYGMELAALVAQRIANTRNPVKRAADSVVGTAFGLKRGDNQKGSWLQEGVRFIYPHNYANNTVEGEKPFHDPLFANLMQSLFFKRKDSQGSKIESQFTSSILNKPEEREIPAPMLALVATALYAAIQDHRLGPGIKANDFTGDHYSGAYNELIDTLNDIRNDGPEEYHVLMHGLYSDVRGGVRATQPTGPKVSFLKVKDMRSS